MLILLCFIISLLLLAAAGTIYLHLKTPVDQRSGIGYISLKKMDYCCNCGSQKIIHGRISSSEEVCFHSKEFKPKFFSITKRPGKNLEKYQFAICSKCGLLGGFIDVSNIQNELKVHGKQSLVDRLSDNVSADNEN